MVELIYSLAGTALSLALSFVPGLKQKYEALSPAWKAASFALLCAAGAVGLAIYQAAHGAEFLTVLLDTGKAFVSSWGLGTLVHIPVAKMTKVIKFDINTYSEDLKSELLEEVRRILLESMQ